MEIFLNRIFATLAAGIDAVTTSLPLTTGHGARFGTIAAGNKVRIVFLDATLNVSEVAYITAIVGDTATIARGQDGSTAVIHLAGDRVEARVGKSTMDGFSQKPSAGTDAITETHAAASKVVPVDADELALADSAAGFGLKKLTLANLKAELQFPAGTRMPFNQTAAPTGWVKDTTAALNDTAMRIVTGAVSSGGSVAFSTASYTPSITSAVGTLTADSHVLTIAEMPSHTHTANVMAPGGSYAAYSNIAGPQTVTTSATGGGLGHSHTVSGAPSATSSAIALSLKYNDFIIATKA